MKKVLYWVVLALTTGMLTAECSKGFESQKAVDDMKVTLSVARYPLVKSDNTLNVKVTEASGKPVTDAVVTVRYYMPPMPGMAPMDFNTQAVLKGDTYSASLNVPAEGGWKVEVSVARTGKPAATTTFNLDAR